MPDVPPPYLHMMRPTKPRFVDMYAEDVPVLDTLDISTVKLGFHRLVGLSITIGYWPDSWQDEWAIEELLKWEGREDEIRRDQYYADFIVDENQQARENQRRQIGSKSESTRAQPEILVVRESVRERNMDIGGVTSRQFESGSVLRLE